MYIQIWTDIFIFARLIILIYFRIFVRFVQRKRKMFTTYQVQDLQNASEKL